jgi:hypothetical protein
VVPGKITKKKGQVPGKIIKRKGQVPGKILDPRRMTKTPVRKKKKK